MFNYEYEIEKEVEKKGELITITGFIPYKEMIEYIVKIINREYFENKSNIQHLREFIINYEIVDEVIKYYHDEIVDEFSKRGYFD